MGSITITALTMVNIHEGILLRVVRARIESMLPPIVLSYAKSERSKQQCNSSHIVVLKEPLCSRTYKRGGASKPRGSGAERERSKSLLLVNFFELTVVVCQVLWRGSGLKERSLEKRVRRLLRMTDIRAW